MRLAFHLLTLGILVGACAAPTDTGKEVAEVVAQLSLPEQLEAILKGDDKDRLVALLDKEGLTSCDLAIRNSELRATTVLELACSSGAIESVRYLLNEKKVGLNYCGRSGWTPLMRAVSGGHSEIVGLLLESGAKTGLSEDLEGQNVLGRASRAESQEALARLIAADVDVSDRDNSYDGPLHNVIQGAESLPNMQALLRAKADINARNIDGVTPLYAAVWLEQTATTAFLLANRADPNIPSNIQRTPLHIASEQGLFKEVQLLLFYGADTSLPDKEGKKPEEIAATELIASYIQQFNQRKALFLNLCELIKKDNSCELANLLSEKKASYLEDLILEYGASNLSEIHPAPPSLLHLAVYYGAEDCVKMLLKSGASQVNQSKQCGAPVLHWAVVAKRPAMVRLLLEAGADVHATEPVLKTQALDYALQGESNILEMLLEAGAKPNATKNRPSSPLLEAATWGDIQTVQQLILAGADPLQKDEIGLYPLLASILYCNTSVTSFMLANGIDLKVCGQQCLQNAAQRGLLNEIKLLLGYKVELPAFENLDLSSQAIKEYLTSYKSRKEDCASLVEIIKNDDHEKLKILLMKHEPSYWDAISREFEACGSILNLAIDKRALQCAGHILDYGKYDARSLNSARAGDIPLHRLIWSVTTDDKAQVVRKFVQLLRSKEADIDFADSLQRTALHVASSIGPLLSVEIMLENQADPNLCDNIARSPVYMATMRRQNDILSALLKHPGTNLNSADSFGIYPVLFAATYGNQKALRLLLEGGAKTYQDCYSKSTPLIQAVRFGSYACVELLLKYKADPKRTDAAKRTALDYARDIPGNTKLVELLETAST